MLTFQELKEQFNKYDLLWQFANICNDWREMKRYGAMQDRCLKLMCRRNAMLRS